MQLRRPSLVFACVWILVAAGLSLGQMYAVVRHNAESSLRVSTSQMQQAPAALYAVDVPELVITFYLDRPVTPVPQLRRPRAPGAGRARRLSADRSASLANWIHGCG